jgi:phosphotriesterase-related protein
MRDESPAGRSVTTVLGEIPAASLGVTLAHEHCLVDLSAWFTAPTEGDPDRPIELPLLAELRRRPLATTRRNVVLDDEELAARELGRFAAAGGASVIDVTIDGIGRDPVALQRLSRATGLNIVMGTGFYVENAHPRRVAKMDADAIAAELVVDLREGVGATGVRAGVIGEIGLTGIPRGGGRHKIGAMTGEEEKVLRGAARASLATGAVVTVHCDPIGPLAGVPAVDVLEQEGVEPGRIVIDHVDQVQDLDYHRALAARGVFVEYDSLGREFYSDDWEPGFAWGHDSWRVEFAQRLIDAGHGEQLLFSQDVCMKMELVAYGGNGYAHVLRNIVPTLLARGVSQRAIDRILIDNPARAFSV